jgi:hypothetical protein
MIVLVSSPADVLSRMLVNLGLVTDPTASPLQAWPAFVNDEPDEPESCVTVYDTANRSDGRRMTDGYRVYHRGVQVRVRAALVEVGFAKAEAISFGLDAAAYPLVVAVDTERYKINNVSTLGVMRVGKDVPSVKRVIHTLNMYVSIVRLA